MSEQQGRVDASAESVMVANEDGRGRYVLLCDHASNFIPKEFDSLGLAAADLEAHIAWDPGALPVAEMLSNKLDAPLVAAGLSRLLVDCNRPLDAPDLIPEISETTVIPGNRGLSSEKRAERIRRSHDLFHAAVERLIEARLAAGLETLLVSVHSFTPVYKGFQRPWEIGILHDADERISQPLIAALEAAGDLTVGDNQPYSPADRVYYTLERHGRSRGLSCAMIEIRNDEIKGEAGQRQWAERLGDILGQLSLATPKGKRMSRTA